MISASLRGGLGNQLFIVCAALAHAERTGQSAVFEHALSYGERPAYWSSVFQRLTRVLLLPQLTRLAEDGFRYTKIEGRDVCLDGYFQSYLYFHDVFELVRPQLAFPHLVENASTSVHFRRGDYKKWPALYPLLDVEYYRAALQRINPESVLYFCEDADWEEVLPMVEALAFELCVPFARADPSLSDVEQLGIMRGCRHHVIANSTYSWWGAYLDHRNNSKTCYPARWLGLNIDAQDLCPPHWIRVP